MKKAALDAVQTSADLNAPQRSVVASDVSQLRLSALAPQEIFANVRQSVQNALAADPTLDAAGKSAVATKVANNVSITARLARSSGN